jgi:hypothetical protein
MSETLENRKAALSLGAAFIKQALTQAAENAGYKHLPIKFHMRRRPGDGVATLTMYFGDVTISQCRIPHMKVKFRVEISRHHDTMGFQLNDRWVGYKFTYDRLTQGGRTSEEEEYHQHPHVNGEEGDFCGPKRKMVSYFNDGMYEEFWRELIPLVNSYNPAGAYSQLPDYGTCFVTGRTRQSSVIELDMDHTPQVYWKSFSADGKLHYAPSLECRCSSCRDSFPVTFLKKGVDLYGKDFLAEHNALWQYNLVCPFCAEKELHVCNGCKLLGYGFSTVKVEGEDEEIHLCYGCLGRVKTCSSCNSVILSKENEEVGICSECQEATSTRIATLAYYMQHDVDAIFDPATESPLPVYVPEGVIEHDMVE